MNGHSEHVLQSLLLNEWSDAELFYCTVSQTVRYRRSACRRLEYRTPSVRYCAKHRESIVRPMVLHHSKFKLVGNVRVRVRVLRA